MMYSNGNQQPALDGQFGTYDNNVPHPSQPVQMDTPSQVYHAQQVVGQTEQEVFGQVQQQVVGQAPQYHQHAGNISTPSTPVSQSKPKTKRHQPSGFFKEWYSAIETLMALGLLRGRPNSIPDDQIEEIMSKYPLSTFHPGQGPWVIRDNTLFHVETSEPALTKEDCPPTEASNPTAKKSTPRPRPKSDVIRSRGLGKKKLAAMEGMKLTLTEGSDMFSPTKPTAPSQIPLPQFSPASNPAPMAAGGILVSNTETVDELDNLVSVASDPRCKGEMMIQVFGLILNKPLRFPSPNQGWVMSEKTGVVKVKGLDLTIDFEFRNEETNAILHFGGNTLVGGLDMDSVFEHQRINKANMARINAFMNSGRGGPTPASLHNPIFPNDVTAGTPSGSRSTEEVDQTENPAYANILANLRVTNPDARVISKSSFCPTKTVQSNGYMGVGNVVAGSQHFGTQGTTTLNARGQNFNSATGDTNQYVLKPPPVLQHSIGGDSPSNSPSKHGSGSQCYGQTACDEDMSVMDLGDDNMIEARSSAMMQDHNAQAGKHVFQGTSDESQGASSQTSVQSFYFALPEGSVEAQNAYIAASQEPLLDINPKSPATQELILPTFLAHNTGNGSFGKGDTPVRPITTHGAAQYPTPPSSIEKATTTAPTETGAAASLGAKTSPAEPGVINMTSSPILAPTRVVLAPKVTLVKKKGNTNFTGTATIGSLTLPTLTPEMIQKQAIQQAADKRRWEQLEAEEQQNAKRVKLYQEHEARLQAEKKEAARRARFERLAAQEAAKKAEAENQAKIQQEEVIRADAAAKAEAENQAKIQQEKESRAQSLALVHSTAVAKAAAKELRANLLPSFDEMTVEVANEETGKDDQFSFSAYLNKDDFENELSNVANTIREVKDELLCTASPTRSEAAATASPLQQDSFGPAPWNVTTTTEQFIPQIPDYSTRPEPQDVVFGAFNQEMESNTYNLPLLNMDTDLGNIDFRNRTSIFDFEDDSLDLDPFCRPREDFSDWQLDDPFWG